VQRIFSLNSFRLALFASVQRIFGNYFTLAHFASVKRIFLNKLFTVGVYNVCETYISLELVYVGVYNVCETYIL